VVWGHEVEEEVGRVEVRRTREFALESRQGGEVVDSLRGLAMEHERTFGEDHELVEHCIDRGARLVDHSHHKTAERS
jgi:hypothetical protein